MSTSRTLTASHPRQPQKLNEFQAERSTDFDLLRSGLFADAEVHCGDRVWKVHKAIVCSRCDWFKKALTGPFEEGQTGIVTITAFEECDIETMLVFLYAGAGPLAYLGFDMRQTYQPASGAPGALYIRIWKTADFFCLEELKTIAVDKFTNYNNIFLPAISLNDPTISTKVTQHLVNCARLIWTETREDLRAIFGSIVLGTLLGGICYFYKTEEFKNLIKEVPDFASQWALSLTAVVGSAGAPEKRAKQCAKCHKANTVEGGCIDVLGWMKEGGSLKTFCTTCIPLPNVQEWKEVIEETS